MDTWTLQMGYPVLTVKREYDGVGKATVSQQRFLLSKTDDNSDKHDYKWWIPITFTTPGGNFNVTKNTVWMSNKQESISVGSTDWPDSKTALVFNVQQNGYYRLNYDTENWKLIIKQLNEDHTKIHVINRAQIIDDALNLARAGMLSYEIALQVTSYLGNEAEYIPWAAALKGLDYIKNMLQHTPAYGSFKIYINKLVEPIYNKLGYKSNPSAKPLDIFLHKLILQWACNVGETNCNLKVKEQFTMWMKESDPEGSKL